MSQHLFFLPACTYLEDTQSSKRGKIVSVEMGLNFSKIFMDCSRCRNQCVCFFFFPPILTTISPLLVLPIHLKMYFKNFQLFPELQFLQIFKEHCEIAVFFRHKACRQTCLTFHSNFPSSSKE